VFELKQLISLQTKQLTKSFCLLL